MMQPRRLTVSAVRDMPFEELLESAEAVFTPYIPPEGMETEAQKIERLSRTIDEMPEIYRWFLQLKANFDHWTDAQAHMDGSTRGIDYKMLRQRRDAMDGFASAAKKRYEGASRSITIIEGFDAHGMPRSRKDNLS